MKDWILMSTAILTLLFFSVSFWIDDVRDVDIRAKDVKRIERSLHEQQNNVGLFVREHLPHAVDDGVFDSCWTQSLHDKGMSLFILRNDSVVYWSDNLPVEDEQLKQIDTVEQYNNIGNGWYVTQAFTLNEYKAITFILIRTEYTYHNNFLKNSFNPIFKFADNMMISPVGSDEGALITGVGGVPLFVLITDVVTVQFKQSTLFRWLAVLSALLLFVLIFYDWSKWRKNIHPLIAALLILIAIRLLIFFNEPYFLEGIAIFSPTLYAASGFLRSLGDLLLHLLFAYLYVLILCRNWNELKTRINKLPYYALHICRLLNVCLIACIAWAADYIACSLVLNSNISFDAYHISNLSIYSLIAFGAILLLLAILFLLIYLQAYLFADKDKKLLITEQIIVFIAFFIVFIDKHAVEEYIFISVFITINLLCTYKVLKTKSPFKYFTIITVLFSLYTTVMLFERMGEREQQRREVWEHSLSAERDPAAEMLLSESEDKILKDTYIQQILTSRYRSERQLSDRLIDYHFKGYFQNYEIQFHSCIPNQRLYLSNEDRNVDCHDFFKSERERYGIPIQGSSHFWFMNNGSGRICYYGEFEFITKAGNSIYLFINLFSKPESESIGYPELLLDSKIKSGYSISSHYSYAKYKGGELVTQYGTYDYSLNLSLQISRNKSNNYFVVLNNYSHYVYKTGTDNVIIISRSQIRIIDTASLFSYNIVLLFIGLLILLVLAGYPIKANFGKVSYRLKITYVLLASITISLTVLTITVLVFIIRQSDERNAASIQEKLRSVMIELEQSHVEMRKNTEAVRNLTYTLIGLSNAFYTDINLYNTDGELIASSRNEVFEKKLLGTRMNREAYKIMTMDVASKYIHWEQIGSMQYYSAYAPYYDNDRKLLAYVNMPYFFKQSEFREEVMQLIASIANIYVLLILLGTIFALFISNQLLRPLGVVQQKMGRLDLTHQPEKIDYQGNDEIGDLVREYNRMIGELAINARKLAATERESAWREMARQIAHEIKNPLTPMRLSIQHIIRMKNNNVAGWQEKLDAVSKSLLEQINILSNIASEFSNFARINERELEPIDLSLALNRNVNLFRVYDKIEFNLLEEGTEHKIIMANNDQLQRVFTNLIKNAVQAVEDRDNAKISMSLKKEGENYIISFEDNGSGISLEVQKCLFQPNFTTKTGGTGLGLAISKNIIESFGGAISYVNRKNGGACFIIQFPVSNIGLELLRKL